ncbi:MAG: enoyl-CoA hydratase/isomerase family protein [Acidimicrobiia bacterium]|nr:enoyl-CoA hydratase/isomerase family protein [Acidimicrobiia bacterium]
MPTLRRDDAVFIIDFGEGENRMTHEFCAEVLELLDEVDAADGPKALVTTATGKIYSNGLDTDYMAANRDEVPRYLGHTMLVCERVLTFPAPTGAAINGHAFGLGAFLQLAHDHRVMRSDRGYICWPEVALGMSFPYPLQELNRIRLTANTLHEAQTTSRRYGGPDAVAADIVHESVPEADVLAATVSRVAPLADTAGPVLGRVKRELYPDVVALLCDHPNPHN